MRGAYKHFGGTTAVSFEVASWSGSWSEVGVRSGTDRTPPTGGYSLESADNAIARPGSRVPETCH